MERPLVGIFVGLLVGIEEGRLFEGFPEEILSVELKEPPFEPVEFVEDKSLL